jgi:hypothetical protein
MSNVWQFNDLRMFFSGVLSYDFIFMTTDWYINSSKSAKSIAVKSRIVPNMIYRILNRAAFQLDQNAFRFLEATRDIVYLRVPLPEGWKHQFDFLYYLNQLRFPPTEASTIDSRVVGTLMKSTAFESWCDKTT